MEELASEAGVSTSLIYYHFSDRAGVLRQTLEFINDQAGRYAAERDADAPPLTAREELEQTLLLELQDSPAVRENSAVWGELRASAVFESDLQEELTKATLEWDQEVAELLARIQPLAPVAACSAAGARLTALVEGLSVRWLSCSLPLERARELLSEAIEVELARLGTLAG